MPQDELYDRIVDEYLKCGSVKKTAETVGTSLVRAQRVLITEGLWHSETSDSVCELYAQGYTTEEIAESLFISVKTVQAYLPYTKGFYSSVDKSPAAKRSIHYRERKNSAADKQINRISREEVQNIQSECISVGSCKFPVMKLRLELIIDTSDRREMNSLRKYAKVKSGIIREILVPSDISLHKLNYAIQKCFGWENSHLHQFSLPSNVFDDITGGKCDGEPDERYTHNNGSFMKWADLCGTYFRFPSEDWDDIYWDDDYEGEISFKSWLKRKYNGSNIYLGRNEHFVCARKEAEDFIKEFPVFDVDPYFTAPNYGRTGQPGQMIKRSISEATVREVGVMFGFTLTELLERLRLNEVLRGRDDKKTTKKELTKLVKDRKKLFESFRKKYINMDLGITSDMFDIPWIEDNIPVLPVTDELIYRYDFGDGWGVKITCDEQYFFDSNDHVFNQRNERIFDEEAKSIMNIFLLRQLQCVYSDGLNVLDDVGGVSGFADFLIDLHEGDPDEREALKQWASGQGWTGRESKPKNIL